MSLVMLINASRPEEMRAAIVRDGKLEALEILSERNNLIKGNIYKGTVANAESSLNACFVEIGVARQGFLSMDDISGEHYHEKPRGEGRPRISDVIRRGRPILVQVTRDAIGNKGPALTTNISLAGRFMVLMPYAGSRGISRKIENEKVRAKIKDLVAKLDVPEGYGYIVRTAGLDQTKAALSRDLNSLLKLDKRIHQEAARAKGATLLHQEGDLVIRMIRDYYSAEFDEIAVDTREAAEHAADYFRTVMPRTKRNITLHTDRKPLFSRYGLEEQIEAIYGRKIHLPSGGTICIDPTEALTAIDVNSAKATREKSQEETAYKTNLEAAREIGRQLRLRDLGGLLVVDFIDMSAKKHNRGIEKEVKEALKPDKARTYVGKISDNGLLEINRQRIKQALQVRTHRDCPTCSGTGTIPSAEFVALNLLRRIEGKASTRNLAEVRIDLHAELADFMQNQYRKELAQLEDSYGIRIVISARAGLHRTEQNISYKEDPGGARKERRANQRAGGQGSDQRNSQRNGSPGGKGRNNQGRDNQSRDNQGRDNQGRDNQGRDNQSRDNQGRDNQVRDNQGRDNQGRDNQGRGDAPRNPDPRSSRAADPKNGDKPPRESDEKRPRNDREKPGRRGRTGRAAAQADTPTHADSARDSSDDELMGRLTKSQKRRLRRKRKIEREQAAARAAEQGLGDTTTPAEGSPAESTGMAQPPGEAPARASRSAARGGETAEPAPRGRRARGAAAEEADNGEPPSVEPTAQPEIRPEATATQEATATPEAKPEAKAPVKTAAKAAAKPKAKAAAKSKAKAPAKSKAKAPAKPKAKAPAKPKAKAPAKPKAKAPAKPKAKAPAKTAAKPKAKAPVKPKAKTSTKTTATPAAKPKAEPEPVGVEEAAVKPAREPEQDKVIEPAAAPKSPARPQPPPQRPPIANVGSSDEAVQVKLFSDLDD